MKTIRLLIVVAMFAIALGACRKPVDDGSLPAQQAKGPIDAVQNWSVGEGLKLSERIAQGIASMRGKGARVDEQGWRAYPGPSDCAGCTLVHYVVAINGESEKYEFLVKDGGKAIEGINEGTKLLLAGPAPRAPKPAPPAAAEPESKTQDSPNVPETNPAPPIALAPPVAPTTAPAPNADTTTSGAK